LDRRHRDRRVTFYALFLLLAVLVMGGQLAQLQIRDHAAFAAQAAQNTIRGLSLPAPRGEIVSSDGVLLASNRPSFAATYFKFGELPSSAERAKLEQVLEMGSGALSQALKPVPQNPSNPVVLKSNLNAVEVSRLAQSLPDLPGVSLVPLAVRQYPMGSVAAPFIGYVTPAGTATGLEQEYNRYLQGTPGAEDVEVNVAGQPVKQLKTRPPVPGDTLHLSINAGLQNIASRALSADIALIRKNFGVPADAGGVVVMNVHTGQILAMVSYPSYNPNEFARGITAAQYAKYANANPPALLNWITQAMDPPGSDFKMVIAVAALETHKITPQSEFYGYAVYPYPPYPHNWTYPYSTGWNDLEMAIAQSCDSYFYAVGHLTGFDAMMYWAKKLGFGAPTGLDLPNEYSPTLPTKQNYPGGFYPAIDYSLAIGQGAIDVTPLQLVDYVALLANRGKLLVPHLVNEITSPSGRVVKRFAPRVRDTVHLSAADWNAIQAGMHYVTVPGNAPGGSYDDTAGPQFAGFPLAVAGKTGTAQTTGYTNAYDTYFVSFAPYKNPQIAVVAFVHAGEEGADTAYAVRDIYDYYFHLNDPTNPMPIAGLPGVTTKSGG
jgi:penicillin-binding protein 2